MGLLPFSGDDRDGFDLSIAPVRSLLGEIWALSDSRQDPVPVNPSADSPAMAEISGEAEYAHAHSERPVTATYSFAALTMIAADDHLDSLSSLYAPGQSVSVYTPPVILRALLETLGRVHWLVDPAIGVRRRVGRMTSELLHQAHWRRLGLSGDERRRYDKEFRRDVLLDWARSRGWEVAKVQDVWYVGEKRPGSKQAIDRVFSGAARESRSGTIFRDASAVAHASLHGILDRAAFVEDDSLGASATATFTVSTESVKQILAVAIYAYVFVADARRRQMGWMSDEWVSARERSASLILDTFAG